MNFRALIALPQIYSRLFSLFLYLSLGCLAILNLGFCATAGQTTSSNTQINQLIVNANAGDNEAQYQLAVIFKDGQQVRVNYLEAAKWFKQAALAGHAKSQYQLALFYQQGKGVIKSISKTFYWLQQASMAGFDKAQARLGVFYYNGTGVSKNNVEAVYWYQLASSSGHSGAMTNLAMMYETGQGIGRNYVQALKWYKKADTWFSKKQYQKLYVRVKCMQNADIRLFWVPLKCADRDVLMTAIKDGGARVIEENKANWGDSYFAPSKLFGPSDLFVAYTHENQFAIARYTFDNKLGLTTIGDVKDVIVESYGEPSEQQILDSTGNQKYSWSFNDGIIVELKQNLGDKIIALSYRDPVSFKRMIKAQQQQKVAPPSDRYTQAASQF